ncbi:MAG: hypothetical protein HQL19_02705 [Candidatus Omnitrophica bacterium]|nr:hypothetical protein [Candidatus Omnitrophota bacterium]
MRKFLMIVLVAAAVCLAFRVYAQSYQGKDALMKAPLDRVVEQDNATWKDVPEAGAWEDAKSQSKRYNQMTVPMNRVIDHDFAVNANTQTIEEEAR